MPRSATAPPPTPPLTAPRPFQRAASPALPSPLPTVLPPCLRDRQVADQLPCGSCPPDRTGRRRHYTCRADGSVPHPAGVEDHATGLVRLRLVRASPSPAFPVPSFWRLSPSPSTPSGVPPRRASYRATPWRRWTPPC